MRPRPTQVKSGRWVDPRAVGVPRLLCKQRQSHSNGLDGDEARCFCLVGRGGSCASPSSLPWLACVRFTADVDDAAGRVVDSLVLTVEALLLAVLIPGLRSNHWEIHRRQVLEQALHGSDDDPQIQPIPFPIHPRIIACINKLLERRPQIQPEQRRKFHCLWLAREG